MCCLTVGVGVPSHRAGWIQKRAGAHRGGCCGCGCWCWWRCSGSGSASLGWRSGREPAAGASAGRRSTGCHRRHRNCALLHVWWSKGTVRFGRVQSQMGVARIIHIKPGGRFLMPMTAAVLPCAVQSSVRPCESSPRRPDLGRVQVLRQQLEYQPLPREAAQAQGPHENKGRTCARTQATPSHVGFPAHV